MSPRTDPILKKIIEEIAQEEGIKVDLVELSIRNVCDWTRQAFINNEYASILWPFFGSFTIIEGRIKEEEQKQTIKEFKRKFKKNEFKKETD